MATPFDRMASLGLLSPQDKQSAALNGLLVLASQLANRGAPRLNPMPPPIDLSKAMNVYQTGMRNAMAQNMMVRKLEQEDELRTALNDKNLYKELPPRIRALAPALIKAAPQQAARMLLSPAKTPKVKPYTVGDSDKVYYFTDDQVLKQQAKGVKLTPFKGSGTGVMGQYQMAVDQGYSGSLMDYLKSRQSQRGRFQNLGPMYLDGKYIGQGTFDKFNNKRTYLDQETDTQKPLPAGAIPRTKAFMAGSLMNASQFFKLRQDMTEDEIAFGQLRKYFENITNTNQGYRRLADQFTTMVKTFATGEGLTLEELSLRVSRGQLQGLLGKMRVSVVGGGVMTEQDALRVIEALGGDATAFQNKEVVGRAIQRIMSEKVSEYNNKVITHNINVDNRFGELKTEDGKSYKRKQPLKIDQNLFGQNRAPQRNLRPPPANVLATAKKAVADGRSITGVIEKLRRNGYDVTADQLRQ